MSIDLLDTPLRVTWDLHHPHDSIPAAEPLSIAGELSAAGVFFVTLDRHPLLHPLLPSIVECLAAGGGQILLVAGGEPERAVLPPGLSLHTLFLDVQPHLGSEDFSGLAQGVDLARSRGYEPALWLVPRRDNLHRIPDVLAFARGQGIIRIKLPNTPLNATVAPFPLLPRPEDLRRLRHLLGENPASLHDGIALEVHDLFLWEMLFPDRQDGRSEYGGCQAANSLAHVDAAGNVHPCSSWPESLGSLHDRSLAEIWDSPARRRVREEIAAAPAGCAGCRDYPLCLGGCRGLGRVVKRGEGGRDPLCPEIRETGEKT